jgi:hypothetical protein
MAMLLIISISFAVTTALAGFNFAMHGRMSPRISSILTAPWIGLPIASHFLPTWGQFFIFLGVAACSCLFIGPTAHALGQRLNQ